MSAQASSTAGANASQQHSESDLWAGLAAASDLATFSQNWLAMQCRMIPGVSGAIVLLRMDGEGSFVPAGVWPDVRRDMTYVSGVAEQAIREKRGVVVPRATKEGQTVGLVVAYPLGKEDAFGGIVVLDLLPRGESELQTAMRALHWGAAGLELQIARGDLAREENTKARLQTVLEVVADAADQDRYRAAAMTLATELATRLECDRVSVGMVQRGRVVIDAISHSAEVKERTNLVRAISAAMDEAVDQGEVVLFPPPAEGTPVVSREHEILARDEGGGAAMSVPLVSNGRVIGALTFERPASRPFDVGTIQLIEALAVLAGPMLDVHRREDRWFGARALTWLHRQASAVFGPERPGLKLALLLIAGAITFLCVAFGNFRISASATLEPLVQIASTAPFNAYVREAPVRAGDLVKDGQVLAKLDDREIRIERLKWLAQQEELGKQLRQALAERNPGQLQVITAQIDQAKAQVSRTDSQLGRMEVRAPFDGIVVSGDLSQQLGAPVERGSVLFEVAPLASFRLALRVDERDVSYVQPGQKGNLLLSAFPNQPIPFTVTKLTPVSTARDGRNYFRVEATLDELDPRLRPNMEGVGKVEIGEARYVWIWARPVIDSIRLTLWQWLP